MKKVLFFELAARWKTEKYPDQYFVILKAVMNHYYDCVIGKRDFNKLILVGEFDTIIIAAVLSAVGYYNYSIDKKDGHLEVTLRNRL